MRPRTRQLNVKRMVIATVVTLSSVAGLFFVAGGHVNAQSFRSGNTANVAAGETVDGSLFISGRTITIDGTVNGDIFCAGMNVTISGTVNGDVLCVAQTLRVSGSVDGDVRLAGQTLTVDGAVSRNATVAGQSVTSTTDSRIGGDLSAAGQDVTLNGSVGRDVALGSEEAVVNGAIGRDVQAEVTRLTLGNQADVAGSVKYTSDLEVQRDGGAKVGGDVQRQAAQRGDSGSDAWAIPWPIVIGMFIALLLLSLVLVAFVPHILHGTTDFAMHNLLKTFVLGLVASIAMPVIIIGLMFTLIGIPLGILLLLLWLATLMLSGPFAAYLLGRNLLRHSDNAIVIMLSGAIVLLTIYLVPFIGQLVMLVAGWFGLGMLLWQAARKVSFNYQVPDTNPAVSAAEPDNKPKAPRRKPD